MGRLSAFLSVTAPPRDSNGYHTECECSTDAPWLDKLTVNWKYPKTKMHLTPLPSKQHSWAEPTSDALRTLTLAYSWAKSSSTQSLLYNKVLESSHNLFHTVSTVCWQHSGVWAVHPHTAQLAGSSSASCCPASRMASRKPSHSEFSVRILLNANCFLPLVK